MRHERFNLRLHCIEISVELRMGHTRACIERPPLSEMLCFSAIALFVEAIHLLKFKDVFWPQKPDAFLLTFSHFAILFYLRKCHSEHQVSAHNILVLTDCTHNLSLVFGHCSTNNNVLVSHGYIHTYTLK